MDNIIKISLILNTFVFLIILRKLYRVIHHGKIIINANKSRFSAIFWTVLLILWCILGYSNYMHSTYNSVLLAILWIEISIFNIIRILKSSGIRENGIYGSGNFYKWSKVQSYSWVLPTTIHFEVNTFFKTNYSFEFIIKEELKSKVNETLQKYVHS